jgi:hypothetical protein
VNTRRREFGQWLVFVAIALLVVALAYVAVTQVVVGSADCACTQAPPASAGTPNG